MAGERLGAGGRGLAAAFEAALKQHEEEWPAPLAGEEEADRAVRERRQGERRARKARQRRQQIREVAHKPPSNDQEERVQERRLRATATRGVVKLFNALAKAQSPEEQQAKGGAGSSEGLAGKVRAAAMPTSWSALKDPNFLMGGARMEDWEFGESEGDGRGGEEESQLPPELEEQGESDSPAPLDDGE